jgi:hypothetical protein
LSGIVELSFCFEGECGLKPELNAGRVTDLAERFKAIAETMASERADAGEGAGDDAAIDIG